MNRNVKPPGLGTWMVIAICLFTSFSLIRAIYDGVQKYGIVAQRKHQLEEIRAQNQKLKQEVAFAETPEFVEREARNKLGLIKEGETVILMGSPSALLNKSTAGEANDTESNWRQWWNLFF